MTSLTQQGPRPDRARVEFIKTWVREALHNDEVTVLVTELRCTKTECPTVETVIALVEPGRTRRWNVPKAIAELDEASVREAVLVQPALETMTRPAAPGRAQ